MLSLLTGCAFGPNPTAGAVTATPSAAATAVSSAAAGSSTASSVAGTGSTSSTSSGPAQSTAASVAATGVPALTATGVEAAPSATASAAPIVPTAAPPVATATPVGGPAVSAAIGQPDGEVSLRDPLRLTFSEAMDQASVQQALALSPAVPGQAAWQGNVLTYTPTQPWPAATLVGVTLAESARGANSGALPAPFRWSFVTESRFAALELSPRADAQYVAPDAVINIVFSHDVDAASVAPNLSLTPAISGKVQVDGRLATFVPTQPLPLNRRFSVTLGAGTRDPAGNTLAKPVNWAFTTVPQAAQQQPRLAPAGGLVTVAPLQGPHRIALSAYGIPSVHLTLYRVPDAAAFVKGYTAAGQSHAPSVDSSGFRQLSSWDAVVPDSSSEGSQLIDVTGASAAGVYYLTVSATGQHDFGQFLSVSDRALLVKQTWTEALVWATAVADGGPLSGSAVELLDAESGRTLGSGATGADGVWQAAVDAGTNPDGSPRPRSLLVIAPSPSDLSNFAIGGTDNEFFQDGFLAFHTTFRVYAYSDRPIYRPGNVVHLRGIVRAADDVHYALPGAVTLHLRLSSPLNGRRIVDRQITPDANGDFTLDVPLASDAASGYYTVDVGTGADAERLDNGAYASFQVESYRKPEYAVSVTIPDQPWVSGDTIPVTVSAHYYFDQPVAGAKVSLRVTRQAWFEPFLPGTAAPVDPEQAEQGGNQGGGYGADVLTRQGTLDASGAAGFSVPADLGDLTDTQRYTVEATVTDAANNPVSNSAATVVHRGALVLYAQPQTYATSIDTPVDLTLTVQTVQGRPAGNISIGCDVVQQTYSVSQEGTAKGAYPVYQLVEVPAYHFDASAAADGSVAVPVRLPRPSSYRLSCAVKDERGNRVTRDVYLWAASSSGQLPPYAAAGDHLSVAADKQVYAVGDVAHLQALSPLADISALVTVERGKVYSRQIIKFSGKTARFDLPVTTDDLPNVQVSVAIQGQGQALSGSVALRVPATSRYLSVAVKADRPSYRPGETATVTLTARGPDGQPAQGSFSLGMVDEAIYALARQTPPTIKAGFYAVQPIQVRSGSSLAAVAGRGGRPGRGGGGGGGSAEAELRSDFPDTGYWSPSLRTGADGTATVQVTMPDSLTTWRFTAIGATDATQVGYVSADVVSTKPFHLQPAFPRFLTTGDHATLSVLLDNATGADLSATVKLSSAALTLGGAAQQQVAVPARGSTLVRWETVVGVGGAAGIVVEAGAGDLADAVKVTLPVVPGGAARSVDRSGAVGSGAASAQFALPAEALPGSAALQLAVTPGLAAGVLAGNQYLFGYPYDCAEQTVSAFLPAILAKEVYTQAGLSAALAQLPPGLDRGVAEAVQRLVTLQHPDGGWNWWSYDQTDPYMTAYVVYGLVQAKRLGYPVVQQNLDHGIASLQQQLASPAAGLSTRAYMLHVLALAGKPQPLPSPAVQTLLARRSEMASYGLADLAQVLQDAGDSGDAKSVLADLSAAVTPTDTTASWREQIDVPPLRGSPVYSTAAALDAYTRLDPGNPLAIKAARYLLAARSENAWSTTHDTAMATMALNRYLLAHGDLQTSGHVTITWNGQVLKEADLTAGTPPLTLKAPAGQVLAQNILGITFDGSGQLFWSAALSYRVPATAPADSATLQLSRDYLLPDGSPVGGPLAAGTVVSVRLTIHAAAPLDYVLVADALPAGLEPVNPALATSQSQPQGTQVAPLSYDHLELGDRNANFYITRLTAGAHTFTYQARAGTAGTFQAPPAEVWQMYAPAVRASSATASIAVGS